MYKNLLKNRWLKNNGRWEFLILGYTVIEDIHSGMIKLEYQKKEEIDDKKEKKIVNAVNEVVEISQVGEDDLYLKMPC